MPVHWRELRQLACAAILIACGSSSPNDLFSGSRGPACSPGTAEVCKTAGSACVAHRLCRSDGLAFESCTCDSSGAGAGGSAGHLGTGGEPFLSGGAGGAGGGFSNDSGGGGSHANDSGGAGGSLPMTCPARSFNGTATGSNYKSSLGTKIDVKASIAFTVDAAGTITGTYTGVSPNTSSAVLSGTMDCSTLAVTIAIENGTYPGSLFPPSAGGTFTGTLTGDYASNASAFSGQWTIQEGKPAYGGQGTWTAN